VKYHRGFTALKLELSVPRTEAPEVIVIFGPTNSGKSHFCREASPDAYWKTSNTTWFDQYDGESDLVIDEFYGWLPYNQLLRMLDKYPMKVETKGGHVNFRPKRIYITSNQKPENWYKNFEFAPLRRRITMLYEFISITERYIYEADGTRVLLVNE